MLLLSIHHIVFDEWSYDVFCRELKALYAAFAAGRPADLPALPIQYGDFAAWQRSKLQGDLLAGQLDYWRAQLADAPPALELPLKGPRPAVQTSNGARHSVHVPKPLTDALTTTGRRFNATPFMTLLAAFNVLMYRYANQTDIVVGVPVTNRSTLETESLIGLFLNLLAIRTDLTGAPSFRDVLKRVRTTALEAYSHQDLPFEQLIDELQLERDLSRSPLVQVMFILQSTDLTALELPGVTIEESHFGVRSSVYDLTLFLNQGDNGLVGAFEYNPDLFDQSMIERMCEHWLKLLEAFVANPEMPIATAPMLSDSELHQQLEAWNATAADISTTQSLCEQFHTITKQQRSSPAFYSLHEGELSYDELDRRSNQLAHQLHACGVEPGTRIGLCLERSFDAVIGLIAILKAGAVYVPLDPAYPKDRLTYMCEDADITVVLTRTAFASALPGLDTQLIDIEDSQKELAHAPSHTPAVDRRAEDTAYIIYTSGSTGRPKGTAVPHRQILNRLDWMWKHYPFTSRDVSCLKTPLSFVDSLWELLGPLLQGSPTVIVPEATLRDPHALVATLERYAVTRLWLVPSLLRALLDTVPEMNDRLRTLKFWVTSGEPLPHDLLERFEQRLPDAKLYNLYGTSEAWDITWHPPGAQQGRGPNVPIGRPISNVRCYVLNEALQPMPVGAIGELYVAGLGLADGYLNQTSLSETIFLDNPFDGTTFYRTGDLARYLDDGTLEYMGRADQQVKLRGFRLEPAEIERLLARHGDVRQAVVALRHDASGESYLVAYVLAQGTAKAGSDALAAYLRTHLPAHMIPSYFVWLDALPLTPSGKVNRRALPPPRRRDSSETTEYVAPNNDIERSLADIFASVLEVGEVGVHDDFFALGGHSLLAVRVVADIEHNMGRRVPVVELFQSRTVQRLAAALRRDTAQSNSAKESTACVALRDDGALSPFFIGGSHPRYTELVARINPARPVYRLDVYALQATQIEHGRKPYRSVEDIARYFVREVQARQPRGPYYLGGGCEGAMVAFEMARQLQAQGETVHRVIMWTTPTWLNVGTWNWRKLPLIRLARQARTLLARGSVRQMTLKQWLMLARHEHLEYRIFKATEDYRPASPFEGEVVLIWPEAVGEWLTPMGDYWRQFATRGARVHAVPGEHDTWLDEHARELGDFVSTCLNESA